MKIISTLSFFIISLSLSAQERNDKIKIRRSDSEFYFFQLGKKTDTISKNKNDLFFLQIPRSKRCDYKIEIQNGQLLKTKSDTVFKLVRLNNIDYIHYYEDSVTTNKNSNIYSRCSKYKVAINGANNLNTPHNIQIKFINTSNDSIILINKFYFK